jgi:hypothetical protein
MHRALVELDSAAVLRRFGAGEEEKEDGEKEE